MWIRLDFICIGNNIVRKEIIIILKIVNCQNNEVNLEFIYYLLIWFWIFYYIYNFTYLFRVLILVFFILLLMLVFISRIIYLKYLVVIVYIRGVVVFIMYISCICWYINEKFSKFFILLGVFVFFIVDLGLQIKFNDIGEFFWIYLYFRFLFSVLVTVYSLNLFKVAGSLRF